MYIYNVKEGVEGFPLFIIPHCHKADIIHNVVRKVYKGFRFLPYIGNFSCGFNFCRVRDLPEIATSLKSPKIDTVKNKPYYTSSLRDLEIAKIGLSKNLKPLPNVIFAKISRRKKFPKYGIIPHCHIADIIYTVVRKV